MQLSTIKDGLLLSMLLFTSTTHAQQFIAPFPACAGNTIGIWEKSDLSAKGNKTSAMAQKGDSLIVFGYVQKHYDKGFFVVAYKSATGYVWDSEPKLLADQDKLLFARTQDGIFCSKEEALQLAAIVLENQKANRIVQDSITREQLKIAQAAGIERQRKLDSAEAAEKIALAKADSLERVKNAETIAWFKKKYSPYGIVVSEWNWNYESEYSYAASVYIRVLNPTNKRIRYVFFSFAGYDAVEGRLTSRGKTIETVKGIGPVEINGVAEWNFDHVFWSRVINTLKISSIKVIYFDGTTKLISNPKEIILDVD